MEIIRQSVTQMPIISPLEKNIENAARNCYKSEHKSGCAISLGAVAVEPVDCATLLSGDQCDDITCTHHTGNKLIGTLYSRKHYAMTEFTPVVATVPRIIGDIVGDLLSSGMFTGVRNEPLAASGTSLVSFNLRSLTEIALRAEEITNDRYLMGLLECAAPTAFSKMSLAPTNFNSDMFRLWDPTKPHPESMNPIEHMFAMFRFIFDSGISHEGVRHRMASFAQESTRYVTYKNGHIQFILPYGYSERLLGIWDKSIPFGDFTVAEVEWFNYCLEGERVYKAKIAAGEHIQHARNVFPISLKTEMVMMSRLSHWEQILKLWCDKAAHPHFVELACQIRDTLNIEQYKPQAA